MPPRQPQAQTDLEGKLLSSFGQRARQRREHAEKGRGDIAQEIGCTTDMIGRYERGENFPPALSLARLGRAVHTSLDYLILGKGPLGPELVDRRLLDLLLAAQELPSHRIDEFVRIARAYVGLGKESGR